MKKPTKSVYAIIRLDHSISNIAIEGSSNIPQSIVEVTVKEIVSTAEIAESEVKRLNEINSEKNCKYFWQHTRLIIEDDISNK